MKALLAQWRAWDWTTASGDPTTWFGINMAHPPVLLLLLLLPLWGWWRRRRSGRDQAAIPFPLTAMLAAGPRPRAGARRRLAAARA